MSRSVTHDPLVMLSCHAGIVTDSVLEVLLSTTAIRWLASHRPNAYEPVRSWGYWLRIEISFCVSATAELAVLACVQSKVQRLSGSLPPCSPYSSP